MAQFPLAVQAWPTSAFSEALKREIESLDAAQLPLQEGVSQGGLVGTDPITAMVLSHSEEGGYIAAEAGVFFTEIVGGCSCGDEPEAVNSYCRLSIRIVKATAQARFQVSRD